MGLEYFGRTVLLSFDAPRIATANRGAASFRRVALIDVVTPLYPGGGRKFVTRVLDIGAPASIDGLNKKKNSVQMRITRRQKDSIISQTAVASRGERSRNQGETHDKGDQSKVDRVQNQRYSLIGGLIGG